MPEPRQTLPDTPITGILSVHQPPVRDGFRLLPEAFVCQASAVVRSEDILAAIVYHTAEVRHCTREVALAEIVVRALEIHFIGERDASFFFVSDRLGACINFWLPAISSG